MQRGAARSRSSAARPGSGRDTRAREAAVSARLLGRGHDSRCSAVRIHKWEDSKQNRHCCVPGDREGCRNEETNESCVTRESKEKASHQQKKPLMAELSECC